MKLWTTAKIASTFAYNNDPQERREQVYRTIDRQGFGWWIVFVAGIGFITDAYDIFALNMVLPMLTAVYYGSGIPRSTEIGLNTATLIGTIFGQITFGFLADKYGRRKMYGLELIMLIGATLGLTMSSTGVGNSMEIAGWLIFWRLMMGFGIGGDYPLSACITSEFAPAKHRGRMMAAVFAMQPLGQIFATLASLVALYGYRHMLPQTLFGSKDQTTCTLENGCIAAIDSTWRWIVGFGTVPAAITVFFRLTIPESPRFTLEVENNLKKASKETTTFFEADSTAEFQDSEMSDVEDAGSTVEDRTPTFIDDSGVVSHGNTNTEFMPDTEGPNNHFPKASWADAHQYFITEGNWRRLMGTAMTWFLLDFAFYGLGQNSFKIVGKIWYQGAPPSQPLYEMYKNNATHSLVVVSIGSLIGSAAMILVVKHFSRRKIQLWGFMILGVLLIVTGIVLLKVKSQDLAGVVITLYVLCQLFFNLGPNTTTFIIAAESFPTRYRCTCHGLSAASGKIGSVVGQIFVNYVTFGGQYVNGEGTHALAYTIICFSSFMFLGAPVTYFWTPEVQDKTGMSIKLEELAKGEKRAKLPVGGKRWFHISRSAEI